MKYRFDYFPGLAVDKIMMHVFKTKVADFKNLGKDEPCLRAFCFMLENVRFVVNDITDSGEMFNFITSLFTGYNDIFNMMQNTKEKLKVCDVFLKRFMNMIINKKEKNRERDYKIKGDDAEITEKFIYTPDGFGIRKEDVKL